jgi:hypothetical protein
MIATWAALSSRNTRLNVLWLGERARERMTMGVINSVAQFERDLLIERT